MATRKVRSCRRTGTIPGIASVHTPDGRNYIHKQNERKPGLRSPANFVHLDGESRYDAPAHLNPVALYRRCL